jgi:hypothetical protein
LTYGLTTTPRGVEAKVSAATRDEFYRDAVAATLEVAYGGTPPHGEYEGSVVPIQATGLDDLAILGDLVTDCLTAVSDARGTLHPPRWLAFDSGRVTANLPATSPASETRAVSNARVLPVAEPSAPYEARILFELAVAH